jgi:hypothetical protein
MLYENRSSVLLNNLELKAILFSRFSLWTFGAINNPEFIPDKAFLVYRYIDQTELERQISVSVLSRYLEPETRTIKKCNMVETSAKAQFRRTLRYVHQGIYQMTARFCLT